MGNSLHLCLENPKAEEGLGMLPQEIKSISVVLMSCEFLL